MSTGVCYTKGYCVVFFHFLQEHSRSVWFLCRERQEGRNGTGGISKRGTSELEVFDQGQVAMTSSVSAHMYK